MGVTDCDTGRVLLQFAALQIGLLLMILGGQVYGSWHWSKDIECMRVNRQKLGLPLEAVSSFAISWLLMEALCSRLVLMQVVTHAMLDELDQSMSSIQKPWESSGWVSIRLRHLCGYLAEEDP
jgi:hypothetical protein